MRLINRKKPSEIDEVRVAMFESIIQNLDGVLFHVLSVDRMSVTHCWSILAVDIPHTCKTYVHRSIDFIFLSSFGH